MNNYIAVATIAFFLSVNSSFADCISVCSLEKLRQSEDLRNNAIISAIDKYFMREIDENIFFDDEYTPVFYTDLFTYNTVLLSSNR